MCQWVQEDGNKSHKGVLGEILQDVLVQSCNVGYERDLERFVDSVVSLYIEWQDSQLNCLGPDKD